ncbi:OLC1v1008973C1 [Oldenlandia corymbosa var. corymbosa]|uniref:OLC1v1008973C1 n=1 Tax=Oldenlandia corymbosa var. corymbosa TaxID=529605 RepID=A0AAV1DR53_OLDCO|nr:OLC1v1008973C1 [Oldenlandia corymbosa var. corymbosa]
MTAFSSSTPSISTESVMAVIRATMPAFRNAHDKIAFIVHAAFFTSGFVLRAAGQAAFNDDNCFSYDHQEVGIHGWNELESNYAFVYTHPNNGGFRENIVVKCLASNHRLHIYAALDKGLGLGYYPDVLGRLQINIHDYVPPASNNSNSNGGYDHEFVKDFGKLVRDIDHELVTKFSHLFLRRGSGYGGPADFRHAPLPPCPPRAPPAPAVPLPPGAPFGSPLWFNPGWYS